MAFKPWDELKCFGYFGFGNGWDVGVRGVEKADPDTCQRRCPQSQTCWAAHLERVRLIMPGLCRVFDRAARRFGGKRAVECFVKKWKIAPPHMMAMVSNMQAATFYANNMEAPEPHRSGPFYPKYPFEV